MAGDSIVAQLVGKLGEYIYIYMYTIFPRCPRARRPQKDKTSIAFIESGVNLYVAATANPKIRPQLLINNTSPHPTFVFTRPRRFRSTDNTCVYILVLQLDRSYQRSRIFILRSKKLLPSLEDYDHLESEILNQEKNADFESLIKSKITLIKIQFE